MSPPVHPEHSSYASPPGDTLAETIESLGLTQTELAQRMGRPIKTINEIIQAKAALTPETALELEQVLGVPASFWNGLETNYREHLARERAAEKLEVDEAWLRRLPIAQMLKLGWISQSKERPQLMEELLRFFGCSNIAAWEGVWGNPEVAYRKSLRLQSQPEALAVWLRKAEIEGRRQRCSPYNAVAFRAALGRLKGITIRPASEWSAAIRAECNSCGVAYVVLAELPKTRVSGAARQLTDDCALIVQTGRYRDDGHFWFTFFHEARHVLQGKLKRRWLVEIENGDDDPQEEDANRFAREFLIPSEVIREFRRRNTGKMPVEAAKEMARELGIAPGIVAGRLQFDRIWKPVVGNQLKRHFTKEELVGLASDKE